ncbi:MAG: hypothetical protein RLY87_1451 [Chloroflexota bacterium]
MRMSHERGPLSLVHPVAEQHDRTIAVRTRHTIHANGVFLICRTKPDRRAALGWLDGGGTVDLQHLMHHRRTQPIWAMRLFDARKIYLHSCFSYGNIG